MKELTLKLASINPNKPFDQLLQEISKGILSDNEELILNCSALLIRLIQSGLNIKKLSRSLEEGLMDYIPILTKLITSNINNEIKNNLVESLYLCTTKESLKKVMGQHKVMQKVIGLLEKMIKKKKKEKNAVMVTKMLMLLGNMLLKNQVKKKKNIHFF